MAEEKKKSVMSLPTKVVVYAMLFFAIRGLISEVITLKNENGLYADEADDIRAETAAMITVVHCKSAETTKAFENLLTQAKQRENPPLIREEFARRACFLKLTVYIIQIISAVYLYNGE